MASLPVWLTEENTGMIEPKLIGDECCDVFKEAMGDPAPRQFGGQ